ncbi:hypothetical protein GJ496_008900 [Pomphorhynchus laevis]|nr:hypothetical protein GJ496_008900 [Pomphorhynchus laevis]
MIYNRHRYNYQPHAKKSFLIPNSSDRNTFVTVTEKGTELLNDPHLSYLKCPPDKSHYRKCCRSILLCNRRYCESPIHKYSSKPRNVSRPINIKPFDWYLMRNKNCKVIHEDAAIFSKYDNGWIPLEDYILGRGRTKPLNDISSHRAFPMITYSSETEIYDSSDNDDGIYRSSNNKKSSMKGYRRGIKKEKPPYTRNKKNSVAAKDSEAVIYESSNDDTSYIAGKHSIKSNSKRYKNSGLINYSSETEIYYSSSD